MKRNWPLRREWVKTLPKGMVIVELGVERGIFSAELIEHAEPKLLYLVDCWTDLEEVSYTWGRERHYRNLRYCAAINNDALARGIARIVCSTTKDAARWFAAESLDMVYLDSSHDRATVSAEIRLYWPKLKHGGILSGHDYEPHPETAVGEVVREHCARYGLAAPELIPDIPHSTWVVRKP